VSFIVRQGEEGATNKGWILFHLREAREELIRTIVKIDAASTLDESASNRFQTEARMNRYLVGFLAMVALGLSASAEDKADDDLEKLQGTWIHTSVKFTETKGPKTVPAPEGGGIIVVFSKDNVVMKEKGNPDRKGTFKIGPKKSPKEIDLVGLAHLWGMVTLGGPGDIPKLTKAIYQLDGDTLTIAYPQLAGGERPTALDSKAATIVTLKRQKP
jgi:uncharacterized protein (TIGR03067 family)